MKEAASKTSTEEVLMISPFFGRLGGSEMHAHKLAKELAGRGIAVTVMGHRGGTPPQDDHRYAIKWVPRIEARVAREKLNAVVFAAYASAEVIRRRNSIDVVHCNIVSFQSLAVACVAKVVGLPSIVKVASSGSNADYGRYLRNPIGRILMRSFSRFVVTSEASMRELLDAGVSPSQLARIPNGVCVESGPQTAAASGERTRVVCVGSLRPVKGHQVILEAWARIPAARRQSCILIFAGDGPLREDLARLTESLGLSGSVEFRGNVSDVPEFLSSADLFVLPSHAEGMSNALLEAMAAGLPCVATDVGANRELLGAQGERCLVPPGDAEALAVAIESLLESRASRVLLGSINRATVLGGYSIEHVASRYVRLFSELTGD